MRRLLWIPGVLAAAVVMLPASSSAGLDGLGLRLQKTVGLDPNECATGKSISVQPGTTVYYCYKVTNTGATTFTMHSLEDSILGWITLPNGGMFDLPPGSMQVITGESSVITATTTNVATWTAKFTETGTVDPFVDVANGAAQVSIDPKAAPALGEAALAFVAAGLVAFGALHLSRKRRNPA